MKIFKRMLIILVLMLLLIVIIHIALWLKMIFGMYFTDHLI